MAQYVLPYPAACEVLYAVGFEERPGKGAGESATLELITVQLDKLQRMLLLLDEELDRIDVEEE